MNFENVIQKVNKFVTIDKNDRHVYTSDFTFVRDSILREMKNVDEAFAKIYCGHCLGGSYADGLKVSKPDEFDLVIHLAFPDHALLELELATNLPGYVKINLNRLRGKIAKESQNREVYQKLGSLIDGGGYLKQHAFSSWIQSIISKVLTKLDHRLQDGRQNYMLRYSMQGPAQTVDVSVGQRQFSVDFVPALRFPTSVWYAERPCPELGAQKFWIAVPKPRKAGISHDLNNLYWITSFVDQERYLIQNRNGLKTSIRLLKKIRDKEGITNFKSYFIKTVVLWETQERQRDYYMANGVSLVFLETFRKLLDHLKDQRLKFFWDDNFNMLDRLSLNQINDIYGKFNAIYKKIERFKDSEPEKLYSVFLTEREMEILASGTQETVVQEARATEIEAKGGSRCSIS